MQYTAQSASDSWPLPNGVALPCLGFGTWQIPDGPPTVQAASAALKAGYRHIDTAAIYHNEASVGQAIRESGLSRDSLFITSKVWNNCHGYAETQAAFKASLDLLGLEYMDLYLIHWPIAKGHDEDWPRMICQTWRAMEEFYAAGLVRAIGVSNFYPHHFQPLLAEARVLPMVNQMEFHPGHNQSPTLAFCRENNILMEAYSPLATGKLLRQPQLAALAGKYQRSLPQICLRWCLQQDVLPLPRSTKAEHIQENMQIFDFELSEDDMDLIFQVEPFFSAPDPDTARL